MVFKTYTINVDCCWLVCWLVGQMVSYIEWVVPFLYKNIKKYMYYVKTTEKITQQDTKVQLFPVIGALQC